MISKFFYNRVVAFALACAFIAFEFMKITRESILNSIASYFTGYDEGNYRAHNFESPVARKRLARLAENQGLFSSSPTSFFNLQNLALTSSAIYLPFLATLFRLGELYGRTLNPRYRNLSIVVACMMLPIYILNIYHAEKQSDPYTKGYNDGYYGKSPQFQPEANKGFQSFICITTLSTFLAAALCSFMFGAATGAYPRGLANENARRIEAERLRADRASAGSEAPSRRDLPACCIKLS